jgi:dienelactone hydrolase
MQILIDQRRIRDIPVLELYQPAPSEKLPVILILHGFTGRKEDSFALGYQLARAGYYAVSIDLHLHGELGEQPFAAARVTPRLGEVQARSAEFVRALIDEYAVSPVADGRRVGLLGFSLGGAVIYAYLPDRSPAVKAAAAFVAGMPAFLSTTFRKAKDLYPEFGVTEELLAEFEKNTPQTHFLEGVVDFPLLMLYGQADPIIPIDEVRKVHAEACQRYTRPERLVLREFAGVGHAATPEMLAQALEWLAAHL